MKFINIFICKPVNYAFILAHFSNVLFAQSLNNETANYNGNQITLSGIDGTASYQETVCPGFSLCFDLFSGSADRSTQLSVLYDGSIPGAAFTTSIEKNPTCHFCWTPDAMAARQEPYVFSVKVVDEADPAHQATFTYSINVPAISVDMKTTDVTCYGNSDGTATASAVGGSGNYLYQWNTNSNENAAAVSGLSEGLYTVQVMDDFGCEATATARILSPRPLALEAVSKHASCMLTDGEAEVSATGGTMPYAYSWMPADGTTEKLVNLSSGVYTAIVTDANGCTAYKQVNISSTIPAEPAEESRMIISDESEMSRVLIYPNPAHEHFTIKNISENTLTVSVLNSIGQDVYHSIFLPANLSVSIPMDDQGNGIYLVKVQQQAHIEMVRLIKE